MAPKRPASDAPLTENEIIRRGKVARAVRIKLQEEIAKEERLRKIEARIDAHDARFDGIEKRLDGIEGSLAEILRLLKK